MERTKLLFHQEERTIGTLSKTVDDNGIERENYLRTQLFNFRVTGYISGPRPAAPNKLVGYRIQLKFTGGEDREVVINHTSVGSFQKFSDALRQATFGVTFKSTSLKKPFGRTSGLGPGAWGLGKNIHLLH